MTGSFLRTALPRCDAIVASLALHHVRTRATKFRLYRSLRAALRGGGRLVVIDCLPAADVEIRRREFDDWRAHLERRYSSREASALLRAWAREDVYRSLNDETVLMRTAGFDVDVVWRCGAFAVLLGV